MESNKQYEDAMIEREIEDDFSKSYKMVSVS